jgi:hypothetical protein
MNTKKISDEITKEIERQNNILMDALYPGRYPNLNYRFGEINELVIKHIIETRIETLKWVLEVMSKNSDETT